MAVVFHDRRNAPWQLVAALAVLLVLLGTLGTLQYRWLGEVSEAERARMRDGLRGRVSEFTQAFDGELTRTYSAFHLASDRIGGGERAALEEAWNRWRAAAPAPGLVRDVYLAEGNAFESAQLQRLDPARHTLEAVAWPAELKESLARAHQTLPRVVGTAQATAPVLLSDTIDARIPALIIPVTRIHATAVPDAPLTVLVDPGGAGRVVIVVLDRAQMLHQLIEPLLTRHFGQSSASDYVVTIASRDAGGTIVYNSSPTTVATAAADVTAGMFDLRADQLAAAPGLFTAALPPPRSTRLAVTIVRKTTGDATYRVYASEPGAWQVRVRHRAGSLDAIVAASRRRNLAIGLGVLALLAASFGLVIAAAPGLFTAALPPPRSTRLAVTIVRKPTGDATYRVDASEPGAWQVRVRHRAGSLDAIVAASRRRNLAIGLGVLALLAESFGLLIAAAQRQQRLARQQMEFVAAVSHELRTPLAVICSAGEILADGVVSERAQVQSYGSLIETEGRRLGDMVERVLQFAGISAGTMMRAHAEVNVVKVVADAVSAIEAEARDRAVTVAVSTPDALPPVAGDADALRSAMQNIVGNAVKYSSSGGAVDVATELIHDGAIVRIRVLDRGIGIDAADLPHIFRPFYRGRRAVDAQVRGSGVGLSVVQHVIHTHGGDVHVDSRGGEGTTVTIVLPVASPSDFADRRARRVVRLRRGAASALS